MAPNGCEWMGMAPNGCEWVGMACEWMGMAANGCEWLGMAANGWEWCECPNSFFPLGKNDKFFNKLRFFRHFSLPE